METIDITMDDAAAITPRTDTYGQQSAAHGRVGQPAFFTGRVQTPRAAAARERENIRDVKFLVTSSRAMTQLAQRAGFLEPLEAFGAQITVDTCILTSPMLPAEIQNLMTNSAKFAYYAPGLLGKKIAFGSLEDCVNSAVAGEIIRDEIAMAEYNIAGQGHHSRAKRTAGAGQP